MVGDAPLLAGGVGVGLLGDVGAARVAGDLEDQAAVAGLDAEVAAAGVEELELLVEARRWPARWTSMAPAVVEAAAISAVLPLCCATRV